MLITRETDYAMRILRALSDGKQMTAQKISESHQVPKQFAYKIIKKLSNANFVTIIRGVEGGCSLSADLKQVTLYDLMVAMGEDFNVISCIEPSYDCSWQKANGRCIAHRQLAQLQQRLNEECQSYTLYDLIYGD